MKKILLILISIIMSVNTFSTEKKEKNQNEKVELFSDAIGDTCTFIKQKDKYLELIINKLKSDKKITDIVCDSDNLKMAYYLLDDEGYSLNLGVGILATNTTKIIDFNRNFRNKLYEYKNFFATLNMKDDDKITKPKKIYVRFYGLVGDKRFFYIGKQEIGNKENKFYGSPSIKETADNLGFFENLEIEYRNEQIIF